MFDVPPPFVNALSVRTYPPKPVEEVFSHKSITFKHVHGITPLYAVKNKVTAKIGFKYRPPKFRIFSGDIF